MEVINSFFSNIKDKLTNPYFGTLILVLIIHHWELIFGIFNFDEGYTLDSKLEFLQKYIANNITWSTFFSDASYALLYMLCGYLIVILTRSIVMFLEFWLMPLITGKIVNKNVVRKTEYDDVVKEREEYFDQYEDQRQLVRHFSKAIDEQTEQIKLKDDNLLKQSKTIGEVLSQLDTKNKELESSQNDISEKGKLIDQLNNNLESLQEENKTFLKNIKGYEQLYFAQLNNNFYSSIDKFPPQIIAKVHELKSENKWNTFLTVGNFFENGGTVGGELLTEMIDSGIAFERGRREDLTPVGKVIYKYKNVFNDIEDYNLPSL